MPKRGMPMNSMVDIEIVLDEKYVDPKVTIQTAYKTKQVENIVYAIENASENDFPMITARGDEGLEFISQRDIFRIYTEDRKIKVCTENRGYIARGTLYSFEEILNPTRFVKISQSEIINIYKVKRFDISRAGTIGVEFDNGEKTWVSRSCVRTIREFLDMMNKERGKVV